MARNPNSFDLCDGDDVDLVKATEQTFAITIGDGEAGQVTTFGDLLDLVERKVAAPGRGACLLRHAFRDLRDRLPEVPRLRPSTRLDALGEEARDRITRRFAPETGPTGWGGYVPLALALGLLVWGFAGIGFSVAGAWGAVAGPALFAAVILRDFRSGRTAPETVGETIRAGFHLTYPDLRRRHGPGRPSDRRQALEALCRDHSAYGGPVDRDTTFFSHVFGGRS